LKKKVERYIAAGGVLVQDERVLVLRWPSRDEIRLPKGHVEAGETVPEAAIREVSEESGYRRLHIEADLGSQRVAFEDKGRRVVRTERYFLMRLAGDVDRPSSSGEAKFDPVWLTWDEALDMLTFEAERNWVRRARRVANRDGPVADAL
jgi:8-oxo-dGTP pyrophosphatase MutT (NUDIX family)